jgi:outer membrane protein TolC
MNKVNMIIRLNTVFIAFVILGITYCKAEISKITIDEIIQDARENNPEILETKKKWITIKRKIPQVRTWPDPQVGVMWEDISRDKSDVNEASMRMYSISQKIFFPGKLTLKGKITKKSAQMAYQMYKAKEIEIISRVKKAYFQLSFVHKSIEINDRNKELLQKFAKIAETKYTVGKAPQHDVLKAQVELSLLVDELITLEQEKDTAEARLNTLLNRPTLSPLGIPEGWDPKQFKLKYEDLEKLTLENRPELKGMDYAVKRSKNALILAHTQFLPDFMVTYRQKEMPLGSDWDNWDAMVTATFPLWFWKQSYGISEAKAEKNRSEAAYQSMRNMVLFEVQDVLVKVDSSWRLVNLFKTSIIPQAEQTMKAATIAYETEKVDFLTLINSQKMLQDIELKYYNALMKYGKNLAELERVVGTVIEPE